MFGGGWPDPGRFIDRPGVGRPQGVQLRSSLFFLLIFKILETGKVPNEESVHKRRSPHKNKHIYKLSVLYITFCSNLKCSQNSDTSDLKKQRKTSFKSVCSIWLNNIRKIQSLQSPFPRASYRLLAALVFINHASSSQMHWRQLSKGNRLAREKGCFGSAKESLVPSPKVEIPNEKSLKI
jgi:hypothetical protein